MKKEQTDTLNAGGFVGSRFEFYWIFPKWEQPGVVFRLKGRVFDKPGIFACLKEADIPGNILKSRSQKTCAEICNGRFIEVYEEK